MTVPYAIARKRRDRPDLTPAEQRVERKRIAEKMTNQGFTQEQIAKQLGVTQRTISEDLRDFNLEETSKSKPAKTATNPKGAGLCCALVLGGTLGRVDPSLSVLLGAVRF